VRSATADIDAAASKRLLTALEVCRLAGTGRDVDAQFGEGRSPPCGQTLPALLLPWPVAPGSPDQARL
jgi:hypothetical protein